MKPRVIIGVVIMVLFTTLALYNLSESISSYVDFEQAKTMDSDRIHVIGEWVEDKPHGFSSEDMTFSFHMQDESGNIHKVEYAGAKPNNFEDADELVVIGSMRGETFTSNDMLVKCPSKYNDPSEAEFTQVE